MSRDVRANPTNKAGKYVDTAEYVAFMRRVGRGLARRAEGMDPEALAEVAALVAEMRDFETAAARTLNDAGYSWADIGRAQGIGGNASWKKYSVKSPHGRHGGSRTHLATG